MKKIILIHLRPQKQILASLLCLIFSAYTHASSLNISLTAAGDLINQIDINKVKEIDSLTISGDLNGTDILVIRKMANLTYLNIENANIVNGGQSYFQNYTTSEGKIGEYFFKDRDGLKTIILPNSIISIMSNAFQGCNSLESININNVTYIGYYAFDGCSNLKVVDISDKAEYIGKYAFRGCSNLTSLTIPDSVTYIGDYAFASCRSLTSLIIGKKVNHIGSFAFKDCGNITFMKYLCPNIKAFCFHDYDSDMSSVKELILGDEVTSIDDYALSGFSGLKSLTIPRSVTSIGVGAICDGINSLKVLCPHIGRDWFFSIESLKEIQFGPDVLTIGEGAFRECESLNSITIPDNVISIGDKAFYGCGELTSVSMGNGVTSIGENAFDGCCSLTSINWGIALKTIGRLAFCDCRALTSVNIPTGVTSIEYGTFLRCYELTNVSLPNGVTSIGDSAFGDCGELTSLNIPNSVTSIGKETFYGCTHLPFLIIPNSVSSIGERAFWRCYELTSINLPNNLKTIDFGTFEQCYSLDNVDIPESVETIGQGAFRDCRSLTSVVIPNNVKSIGSYAFYGCSGMTSLTIGENVTLSLYGGSSFGGCNNLTSVTILCKEFDGRWFSGKESIKELILGNNVKGYSYGHDIFENCHMLNKITSWNKTPPQIASDTFNEATEQNATLYVPKGSKTLYWLHPYWENFAHIEEMEEVEDISENKANAMKAYQDGMDLYERYIYYYKGDGHKFYITTIDKQDENNKVSSDILYDIDILKQKLSESNMDDDERNSYNKKLDEIDAFVYALKKENESGHYINFYYRVQKNYEPFSEYYNQLSLYKERINATTTNEELSVIIDEITNRSKGMEDYYLNPIIDDYNDMVNIFSRFTEIGDELSNYQQELNALSKEINSTVTGIWQITKSNDDNVVVVGVMGERFTIKQSVIHTLPKGVYIVDGKKIILK